MSIDTQKFSSTLRRKSIDLATQRLLITNFRGSEQVKDFKKPPNCNGFGRVRHFHRFHSDGWPENPLPIDPAAHKLGIAGATSDTMEAQVFQTASCNWRCWYCFVPFAWLNADEDRASWLTVGELLDLYEEEPAPPHIIDLTGGQPDLTPEWVPWMMRELQRRKLDQSVYLWSDDNLSTDYFWKYLSEEDIELVKGYRNYGKVCCFKGFNSASFSFNTKVRPELFAEQLALFRRYLDLGIDLYGYATFTALDDANLATEMARFCDELQAIHTNLPLRVVPLEIVEFTPTRSRMGDSHRQAIDVQWAAVECWNAELEKRFSSEFRSRAIYEIPLLP